MTLSVIHQHIVTAPHFLERLLGAGSLHGITKGLCTYGLWAVFFQTALHVLSSGPRHQTTLNAPVLYY